MRRNNRHTDRNAKRIRKLCAENIRFFRSCPTDNKELDARCIFQLQRYAGFRVTGR